MLPGIKEQSSENRHGARATEEIQAIGPHRSCLYKACSATLGALVACAISRDGHISLASLAFHMVHILDARLLAVTIGLDGCRVDCGLVCWSTRDERNCLCKCLRLSAPIPLPLVEVRSDEITAWLDLCEIVFNRIPILGGILEVLVCLQQGGLLLCKFFLQIDNALLCLSLLLGQIY